MEARSLDESRSNTVRSTAERGAKATPAEAEAPARVERFVAQVRPLAADAACRAVIAASIEVGRAEFQAARGAGRA